MASILSPAPLDPPLLTNSRAIWARIWFHSETNISANLEYLKDETICRPRNDVSVSLILQISK